MADRDVPAGAAITIDPRRDPMRFVREADALYGRAALRQANREHVENLEKTQVSDVLNAVLVGHFPGIVQAMVKCMGGTQNQILHDLLVVDLPGHRGSSAKAEELFNAVVVAVGPHITQILDEHPELRDRAR